MRMMEVRCCCQPQKLLGALPVRNDATRGDVIRFVVPPSWDLSPLLDGGQTLPNAAETIDLPVEEFLSYVGVAGQIQPISRLALKSEETPIEVLRRIPGFVEYRR